MDDMREGPEAESDDATTVPVGEGPASDDSEWEYTEASAEEEFVAELIDLLIARVLNAR